MIEEDDKVEIKEKEQDQSKGYFGSEKEDKDDVSDDDCDEESEDESKCNNRRRFMNLRNTAKRNNLREKTRNHTDGDDNNVMKEVDDFSDDDSGADEEFDLNKAFDFEGEENLMSCLKILLTRQDA